MLIKSCLNCKYHTMKLEEEPTSHCERENCWSRFSKCISIRALERYLKEESFRSDHPSTALDHASSWE